MGFSFILAWRATVSTALVYNYWRLCWQQSTLCGLWASQRHHISLASLTHAYAGLHRLATNTRERKSIDTQNSGTQKKNIPLHNSPNNDFYYRISSNQSHFFTFLSLDTDYDRCQFRCPVISKKLYQWQRENSPRLFYQTPITRKHPVLVVLSV